VKLKGSQILAGTPQQVWDLLTDPARLAKCLPGCERLEPAGDDRYTVEMKLGLAAVSGRYSGSVALSEKKPPTSFRMKMEGKGAGSFVSGEGKIELADLKGATQVRYAGEAQVGGAIAAVGQRMMEAAAKNIVQQFFENAAALLKAAREAGSSPGPARRG